jgi:predicted ABC-type ATPase
MRIFAGPNGSGKSTLAKQFIKERSKLINPSRHINPDDFDLIDIFDFDNFGLKVDENNFRDFFISQSSSYKDCNIDVEDIRINNNRFYIPNKNSYVSAILAEYLRRSYIHSKETLFSYETVFSHKSKVNFLKEANDCGWLVYLYFVSISDPYINCARVEERVLKGEHDVPHDKILERYTRSLENLYSALQYCRRAYIFDNSTKHMELVAEKTPDNSVILLNRDPIPSWVNEYVLSKIK